MPHPLFTLLSQADKSTAKSPVAASETSLADVAAVAEGAEGSRGAGVDGAEQPGPTMPTPPVEPGMGWSVAPGVAILAIQDPDGRIAFTPGLTIKQRREILFDIEWFDVRVKRRRVRQFPKQAAANTSGGQEKRQ